MSSSPVLNPEIPYVGEVEGGLFPGKMVKVQGKIPPQAVRFAINYQLGPNINPRDDIAIHLSPRFPEGFVTRNHIESMSWGREENAGPLWLAPGQGFEIIILCENAGYKIAINGRHFAEFAHRLPFDKVTHLVIDGDVEVVSVRYESGSTGAPQSPRAAALPDVPAANFGPPGPGGLYPTLGSQDPLGPQGGGYQPPGGYGPPPDAYGGSGGYNPPRAYGYQPGYEKPEEEEAFGGGCLDKVGLALGGLVAVGGVAAAMHAMNKKKEQEQDHEKSDAPKSESEKEGGFGGLDMASIGTALASSLAANALQGNSSRPYQQSGYPSQDSNSGGGVLGSIFGALGGGGGGGGGNQPYAPQQSGGSEGFGGALSSILGGVLGGGGNQQPNYQPGYQPNYQPGYQPSGGYNYQPSGGYPSSQGSDGSNLLSGIGSALGSSLLNSALDGLSKHGKDKSQGYDGPGQGPVTYGAQNDPPTPRPISRPTEPAAPGGGKLSAAEISRGLGLSDDED